MACACHGVVPLCSAALTFFPVALNLVEEQINGRGPSLLPGHVMDVSVG